MLQFLVRRLIVAILVTATVMTLAFILTRLSGDLAISIAGPNATQADVEAVRKAYGLDRPLTVQFFDWVGRAATGDLGESYFFKAKVSTLIGERMPITITLGLTGLVIALLVSLPLGILAAVRENTALDRVVQMVALLGQAMPSFWLGLILMITLGLTGLVIALLVSLPLGILAAVRENTTLDRVVQIVALLGQAMPSFWLGLILMITFGLQLGWLPISGTGSWQHYVMPGIVLAFSAIPALTRLTRAGMIQAMGSDYIRTARAKGLSRASILLKHALRNAAIPVVAIAAVQLGFMLGGSIVIEQVFALHGVGFLAWESIGKNDFPVVQAVVLVLAVIYVALTMLADLMNAVLDPRLRGP
ncbi:MAG TPA: ABC transporter permease [Reyranella sp.]|nr:ABC transporter permease [Reyranella sp.]